MFTYLEPAPGVAAVSKFFHSCLVAGAAAAVVAGWAIAAQALEVDQVQLAVADSGGVACPRKATLTAWAHTNGPGIVKFVIRNDSGGKTGELSAKAVRGPAGSYLATYKRTFKITADVDIKYMAEVAGHGRVSNWVPFKATCGPQARKKTSTRKADARPPTTTHKPIRTAPKPKRTAPNKGKPAQGGQSTADTGKPVKVCGTTISATRLAAATRATGKATARAAWAIAVRRRHPSTWANWGNAVDRSSSCKFLGLWDCKVSARPCAP